MRNFKVLFFLVCLMALVLPLGVFAQDATEEPTEEMTEMSGEMLMGQDMMAQCADPASLPETVNIGAMFDLSGSASVYGLVQQAAVNLAKDQINAAGYLGEGVTLNVQFQDVASDAQQAINIMTTFTEDANIVAVIGPTLSTEAVASVPVAQEAGLPVLGVSNTATGLRAALGDFYHRASLPESAVIPGTIAQATELLGLQNVGVFYGNDDDFTLSGYDVFVQALADNGVNIVSEETFLKGDLDFNTQLTNLIGQNPDALVVSALAAEAIQIVNQARQQGYTGPIIGGNGFNSPAVLTQTEGNNEGLIVGGAWNYDNPNPTESSVQFVAAYEAASGGTRPDQFAAQAYTGTWLVATAIRCADSVDHAAFNEALGAIADMETPLGTFSFDEAGEPTHEPIAQIVQEGRFVPLAVAMGGTMEATAEATEASS
jgi:branched-chain amino acid transport system substrate-binding protein